MDTCSVIKSFTDSEASADLAIYMLSFLSVQELLPIRRVSTIWRRYASADQLWARHLTAWGEDLSGGFRAFCLLRRKLIVERCNRWGTTSHGAPQNWGLCGDDVHRNYLPVYTSDREIEEGPISGLKHIECWTIQCLKFFYGRLEDHWAFFKQFGNNLNCYLFLLVGRRFLNEGQGSRRSQWPGIGEVGSAVTRQKSAA